MYKVVGGNGNMSDYISLNETEKMRVFHTLFTGQTNLAGKTTAIRSLAPRLLEAGYTVLIFDTKPTVREFSAYHDIPLCYKPTTDPLVLIGLLEGIFRRKLTIYYPTLSRLTENARDIPDIIQNAELMEERSKSGFIKDACHTLADLLRRLQNELSQYRLSPVLELRENTINVLQMNTLSTEAQQLIMKTAFELVLRHHNKKTVLIIDEAFRFLPQNYSSACKKAIEDVVTQGAKTGLFVWLATQFIATTEKDVIKAMANKLLGRQDDVTEIKATIERMRDIKIKPDDLMTLKPGEFIFVPVEGEVRKVYIPIYFPISKEETAGRLREFPEPTTTSTSVPIQLEHTELVVEIKHIQKKVSMTTKTGLGAILYVMINDLKSEATEAEISEALAEHGWPQAHSTLAPNLAQLCKRGFLIKVEGRPSKYRLPKFVVMEVSVG